MPKPWVVGTLVRELVSFAGNDDRKDVSQLLIQPFVNYNLPGGWYVTSSPIITNNWEGASGQRWNVPIGGGGGRLMRINKLPINVQTQAFYYVEHPRMVQTGPYVFNFSSCFPSKGFTMVPRRCAALSLFVNECFRVGMLNLAIHA